MQDRLRIVIAAEHTGVGAAETYAFSLARALATAHDVDLLVFAAIVDEARAAVSDSDVAVGVLPASTRASFFSALRRFTRDRPDVVHANHAVSSVLVAARLARVPATFITDHVLPLRPSYGARGRALQALTRYSARAVICFSRQNENLARSVWSGLRVFMIYAGVPQPTCSLSRLQVRAAMGIADGVPLVVTVGRLTEQKQQDVLIRAVGILRRQGQDLRVALVGEGEDRFALEALAATEQVDDIVRFEGFRSDVGCVLSAADLYVQVSKWEGICFALLEAAARGLPAIVSRLPALVEVVDGTGASLVEVADAPGLAAAIGDALRNDTWRHNVAHRMRVRWAESFTVDSMATGHELAYEEMLGRGGPR